VLYEQLITNRIEIAGRQISIDAIVDTRDAMREDFRVCQAVPHDDCDNSARAHADFLGHRTWR
jgi:hypothetical protein